MTLIRKPHEIQVQDKVKCLIYGQAGTGKTTMALSAPKPLLLDFDGGASRLNTAHRADTVQIQNWAECMQVMQEDLSAYETIVVDTIGKMLDFIITDVCKGRVPQINNWGTINNNFTAFCRQLHSLNKNIIFIAHRDNRKEGDKNVFIPAIREKSYNAIVTELDLMGYIESRNDQREITFDFSDRNDGKNTCNLPRYIPVPTIVDNQGNATAKNDFIERVIITPFVSRLKARNEEVSAYTQAVDEIKEQIFGITDEVSANDFMERVIKDVTYPHVGSSKVVARQLFSEITKKLALAYNSQTQRYEHATA